MTRIQIKLRDYLEAHQITPYQLGKVLAAQGGPNPKTVYNVVNGASRPDLETLEAILSALPKLTHQAVKLEDVLEVVEVPEPKLQSATGSITRDRLKSIPPSQPGKPRGLKGIKPKGGLVSDGVAQEREERELSLLGKAERP